MSSSLKTRGEGKKKNSRIGIFTRRNSKGCFSLQPLLSSAIHNFEPPQKRRKKRRTSHFLLPAKDHRELFRCNKKIARQVGIKWKAADGDARQEPWRHRQEPVCHFVRELEWIGSMWEAVDDIKHTFFKPPIRGRGKTRAVPPPFIFLIDYLSTAAPLSSCLRANASPCARSPPLLQLFSCKFIQTDMQKLLREKLRVRPDPAVRNASSSDCGQIRRGGD